VVKVGFGRWENPQILCRCNRDKNDSLWDNIMSSLLWYSNTFLVKSVTVAPSITYLLDILMVSFWLIYTEMVMILCWDKN